ncbi:TetR/AcrR family transcriptional regulator [Krasilnikoviella flava]|uniref:Transcriptional regulator, TetR family n=1 Tax=Krasilnikoviella flava TaxID=526729 RepID=A0A1T5JGD1_9MICO|nr:helix-turn-helix domain-containing protein [Krasilnikoviella flava]SKC50233.1 transcriptional regulator, TetR family [Krasilnikoviella flava]
MPTDRSNSRPTARSNPGPAAAARNRAALLDAAHAVFAESGTAAPLSSVARRAGVGQGSLYRHFPDRVSLVAAVVEENVAELEAVSVAGAALPELLGLVTRHAIESVGVVDLLAEDRPGRMLELRERVAAVLAAHLAAALAAGQVPAGTTVEDLMLGVELVAGALTRRPAAERAAMAARAWRLLGISVSLP